jgi:hypothetical protein
MNTRLTDLHTISTHIVLNADYVEEQSTDKYTVLHVEPWLYAKFLALLESMTQ